MFCRIIQKFEKDDATSCSPDVMINQLLDCEVTMPLRAPSELSGSLYIFVSSFDGLDEDDDVLPPSPPPLTLLFSFQMFELLLNSCSFFFFLLIYNYLCEFLGRSFTVHHQAAGRSVVGMRNHLTGV